MEVNKALIQFYLYPNRAAPAIIRFLLIVPPPLKASLSTLPGILHDILPWTLTSCQFSTTLAYCGSLDLIFTPSFSAGATRMNSNWSSLFARRQLFTNYSHYLPVFSANSTTHFDAYQVNSHLFIGLYHHAIHEGLFFGRVGFFTTCQRHWRNRASQLEHMRCEFLIASWNQRGKLE